MALARCPEPVHLMKDDYLLGAGTWNIYTTTASSYSEDLIKSFYYNHVLQISSFQILPQLSPVWALSWLIHHDSTKNKDFVTQLYFIACHLFCVRRLWANSSVWLVIWWKLSVLLFETRQSKSKFSCFFYFCLYTLLVSLSFPPHKWMKF